MDLLEVQEVVNNTLLSSSMFPYRTGYLHDHFFDNSIETSTENSLSYTILNNKEINYGRILEVAPAIRYRLRRIDKHHYDYIKHTNRHFRYIERIIDNDVVQAIESKFGVKKI